jgi:hypothetical protein
MTRCPSARRPDTPADKPAALKNADALLHDVLKAVDTSGDGQIQYNGAHGSLLSVQDIARGIDEMAAQNSEYSSSTPSANSGNFLRALIVIITVNSTKTNSVQPSQEQDWQSRTQS